MARRNIFISAAEWNRRLRAVRVQRRLVWRYGPERAMAIHEDRDPAALDDLEAWQRLGEVRS
jgi:hypothetical protein